MKEVSQHRKEAGVCHEVPPYMRDRFSIRPTTVVVEATMQTPEEPLLTENQQRVLWWLKGVHLRSGGQRVFACVQSLLTVTEVSDKEHVRAYMSYKALNTDQEATVLHLFATWVKRQVANTRSQY